MPELPDLTVFAESLRPLALNRQILDAVCHKTKRVDVPVHQFHQVLVQQRITGIQRVGKAILFSLSGGNRFLVHLMLSGGFAWCRGEEHPANPVVAVVFDAGESLVIFDPRSLVRIMFNPDLEHRAVDALEVTPEYLEQKCKETPKMLVKAFLIDQGIVSGIGNAYSDEILWECRIAPRSLVGKLPRGVIGQLAAAIRSVLTSAIEQLRTRHPGMLSGEVRDFLAVHNPGKKLSPTGHAIIREEIASKKSYFTDEQVLYL